MRKNIYIADDDDNIRETIKAFLEKEGYNVTAFETGEKLLVSFINNPADLIILDVMMPGLNGFEICTKLRDISTVPIIILTARDSDLDYATGLSLGSDDYFTKPFSAISLVMRVKSIFRRIEYEKGSSIHFAGEKLSFGNILVDNQTKTVSVNNENILLTPNEFDLLKYLIMYSDRAVSRTELLENIWGYKEEVETRATDDTVRRLRKKIISSNVIVDAVWGFGFKLNIVDENV